MTNGVQSGNGQVRITYTPSSCSGLPIANQASATNSSPTPRTSGSWSFTIAAQNCTGGDLHAMKIQGGTAGWLSGATATRNPSTGTVAIKPNAKNQVQVVSWSFPSLANGQSASITVTVSGQVPKGTACGSTLPISGNWSATGLNASNSPVNSGPSAVATISVTC
jgi:hypothetical protein